MISLRPVVIMCSATLMAGAQTVDHPLKIGGDVQPPKLVKQVDPKFTRKMRKLAGNTESLLHIVLDEHGVPATVSVERSGGDMFDKEAMDAVRQYRFEPAMRNGTPVAVELNIAVNFQISQRR